VLCLSFPCPTSFDAVEDLSFQLGVFIFLGGCGELPRVGVELGSSGDRGLVDPVTTDGLGEHVEGGLVVFDDNVGMVGVSPSGHRGVDTAAVGGGVNEKECDINGSALGGVAGLCVAEFEILGHILAR
jgi:hypothetical protein